MPAGVEAPPHQGSATLLGFTDSQVFAQNSCHPCSLQTGAQQGVCRAQDNKLTIGVLHSLTDNRLFHISWQNQMGVGNKLKKKKTKKPSSFSLPQRSGHHPIFQYLYEFLLHQFFINRNTSQPVMRKNKIRFHCIFKETVDNNFWKEKKKSKCIYV